MSWMQEKVREFHEAMGQPAPEVLSLDNVRMELRAKLILEEALEVVHAAGFEAEASVSTMGFSIELAKVREPNWPDVIDGLCDLMYVVLGTAVEAGFSLAPFFHEVHRSNMTKAPAGKPALRADGKVLKPQTYEPPRIKYLLERQIERWRKKDGKQV